MTPTQLRPVCFMVMGYRVKPVPGPSRAGAPTEIDCDALWERIYKPALETLGYQAVRGDCDPSSVILTEMIERLAWADLVVADVTLPNGNVYYEVGLRHVARDTSCVLAAADWSQPLFDIAGFSSVRFPLTDGTITEADAERARAILVDRIPKLKDVRTPYHELIVDTDANRRRGAFRENIARIDAFQSAAREARLIANPEDRTAWVAALRAETPAAALEMPEVAAELLTLIRDCVGWEEVLAFIDTLPPSTRALGFVEEQRLLALGKGGDVPKAIAGLETLIRTRGETPERRGLLGGRCKSMWTEARDARVASGATKPSVEERRWLSAAIEHYTAGMAIDLNEYYCATNLPPLLRARAARGDVARAEFVNHVVYEQCQRALARGSSDEWLRPALFNAAVQAGRMEEAQLLLERIALDGAAAWKVDSILGTLDVEIANLAPGAQRDTVAALRAELASLAP